MHHDVAAQVARLAGELRPGRPVGHRSGLTTVPLHAAVATAHGAAVEFGDAPAVAVSEMRPPVPDRLLFVNRGEVPVHVHAGDLVTGGLATRAVREAAVVRPATSRVLAVEAVDSRWWWTGPNRPSGALEPPLSALLALSGEGGPGLGAIARTCLWAVAGEGDAVGTVAAARGAPASGWLVTRGDEVLAARLWGRPRALPESGPAPPGSPDEMQSTVRRFLTGLSRVRWREVAAGEGRGELGGSWIHVAHDGGELVEVGVVRATADLADALLPSPGEDR